MAFENTYLDELATLEDLQSQQVTAQTDLDTVDAKDVPDRAFNIHHFSELVTGPAPGGSVVHGGGRHTYVKNADSCAYATFAAGGLGERAVVGEPSTGSYAGPSSEVVKFWSPVGNRPCALLLANVELVRATELGVVTAADEINTNLVLAFQVQQGGTWRTVDMTERKYNIPRHMTPNSTAIEADIALHFCITQDDLPVTGSVSAVRLVLAIESPVVNTSVVLDRWAIDFLPLFAQAG